VAAGKCEKRKLSMRSSLVRLACEDFLFDVTIRKRVTCPGNHVLSCQVHYSECIRHGMKTRLLLRRKSLLIAIGVSVVLCATAPAFGTKKNASIQFLVINDSNGRPVMNAEIVIHAVDRKGGLRDDSVELKSHQDGKAEITGIPYGKLRVEVISAGFKTFQKDYDINQPSMGLTIKLQKADGGYVVK